MREMKARIAQLVEQLAFNQLVLGSSPSPRTSLHFNPLTKPDLAEAGSLGTEVGTSRLNSWVLRDTGAYLVVTAFTAVQIDSAFRHLPAFHHARVVSLPPRHSLQHLRLPYRVCVYGRLFHLKRRSPYQYRGSSVEQSGPAAGVRVAAARQREFRRRGGGPALSGDLQGGSPRRTNGDGKRLGAFAGGAAPGDLGGNGVSHDRHLAGSPAAVAGVPTSGCPPEGLRRAARRL